MRAKTLGLWLCAFVAATPHLHAIPGFTKFQDLNTAFCVPPWQSESLWTESERDVGKRLASPRTGRTGSHPHK